MATFVIGDIQGCYDGLRQLLDIAKFKPEHDTLIAVGDLVARGHDSLSTLTFLHSLGDSFQSVLGNHDLHLLALASGIKKPHPKDFLQPLLDSPMLDSLVHWLRQKPLALEAATNTLVCHAGLYPQWSFSDALQLSHEVSQVLKSDSWLDMISAMYGNGPEFWRKDIQGIERLRFIINAFTRMRYLHTDGAMEFSCKLPPEQAPKHLQPWFTLNNPHLQPQQRVIFGHWAALLGLRHPQFIGLDTGYVWGNQLTVIKLTEESDFSDQYYQVSANTFDN